MKRVLAFVFAVMMILTLVSCGGGAVERGDVSGSGYENSSVGITFTKPEGWEFLSEEELSVDLNLGGKSFEDQFKDGTAYDAKVKDSKSGNTIVFKFVDLNKVYSASLTVEEYAAEIKKQLKQANPTATVALSDVEVVSFGGEEFSRVVLGTTQNKATFRRVLFLKKMDDVMFVADALLLDSTTIPEVEKMFK